MGNRGNYRWHISCARPNLSSTSRAGPAANYRGISCACFGVCLGPNYVAPDQGKEPASSPESQRQDAKARKQLIKGTASGAEGYTFTVSPTNPDRSSYFPAIEKKYGQPMSFWFERMQEIADQKYADQIAYLRENHGFSQAHANAVVLYCRGSKSARRYDTVDQYLAQFDEVKQKTVRSIFAAIQSKFPNLELVIAWNQPMLKFGAHYVFGVTVLKNHILLAPWSTKVLADFSDQLAKYEVNKKTFKVPVDWKVNKKLLQDMVARRIKELE